MKDSGFKLREKTALIFGPIQSIARSLAIFLTELGVDVALVDKNQFKEAERFAANLMDGREINEHRGRAAAIGDDFTSPSSAKDIVSRVAEIFGSVDVFIDTRLDVLAKPLSSSDKDFKEALQSHLESLSVISREFQNYLLARGKGRMIFLMNDFFHLGPKDKDLSKEAAASLSSFVHELARSVSEKPITVNGLSLGLTEEYLLARFPKAPSIEYAKKQIVADHPHARLVEPTEVANVIAFLASPLSSAINGQILHVNHGL